MSSAALTDFLPDTAYVARAYCPGCEPDADEAPAHVGRARRAGVVPIDFSNDRRGA